MNWRSTNQQSSTSNTIHLSQSIFFFLWCLLFVFLRRGLNRTCYRNTAQLWHDYEEIDLFHLLIYFISKFYAFLFPNNLNFFCVGFDRNGKKQSVLKINFAVINIIIQMKLNKSNHFGDSILINILKSSCWISKLWEIIRLKKMMKKQKKIITFWNKTKTTELSRALIRARNEFIFGWVRVNIKGDVWVRIYHFNTNRYTMTCKIPYSVCAKVISSSFFYCISHLNRKLQRC